MLYFATSLHVAWTVWAPFVSHQWLTATGDNGGVGGEVRWSYFLQITSLHWAAILGGIVGAVVVTRYGKKPIYVSTIAQKVLTEY